MLNLVLFGPPGAGKGTQSAMIAKAYRLIHVSTGDLLRKEKAAGTPLGLLAAPLMDAGILVPDEIVIGMIENLFINNPSAPGFIFDGFPRTVAQATALDELMVRLDTNITSVLSLTVDEDELVTRLLKRAEAEGRADDNETAIRIRFGEYLNKTLPVEKFYMTQGKLSQVNGIGSVDEIFERLRTCITALNYARA